MKFLPSVKGIVMSAAAVAAFGYTTEAAAGRGITTIVWTPGGPTAGIIRTCGITQPQVKGYAKGVDRYGNRGSCYHHLGYSMLYYSNSNCTGAIKHRSYLYDETQTHCWSAYQTTWAEWSYCGVELDVTILSAGGTYYPCSSRTIGTWTYGYET